MIASRKSLITVSTIDCALRMWLNEAVTCGGTHGSGAVFCPTEKQRDDYLVRANAVLPAHERTRIFHGPITYRLASNASLSIHVVKDLQEAAGMVETWPFVIIDDPMSWIEPRFLRFLTTRLKPRFRTRMTLVTVGSPLNPDSVPTPQFDDGVAPREIDYSAITRSLA
jgi:hypothetical protein